MKSKPTIGRLLLGLLYASITAAILVAVMLAVPARTQKILIGGEEISVEIANTPALQEQGLSGHKPLAQNEGMLFVFSETRQYGFWMKDMLFPIDIIWFDEKCQVVDVWENAQPASYPKVVTPHDSARYVLEVPSGFFATHHLKKGDTFQDK